MTNSNDDEDLIRRPAGGDSTAVSALLERYRDRLKRMVSLQLDRRVQKRVDASDVVQEALIVASNHLHEYSEAPSMGFSTFGFAGSRQISCSTFIANTRAPKSVM